MTSVFRSRRGDRNRASENLPRIYLGNDSIESRAELWTWVSLTPKVCFFFFFSKSFGFSGKAESSLYARATLSGSLTFTRASLGICVLSWILELSLLENGMVDYSRKGSQSEWLKSDSFLILRSPNGIMKKQSLLNVKLLQIMEYWGYS